MAKEAPGSATCAQPSTPSILSWKLKPAPNLAAFLRLLGRSIAQRLDEACREMSRIAWGGGLGLESVPAGFGSGAQPYQ
jgi:hypothetical protein